MKEFWFFFPHKSHNCEFLQPLFCKIAIFAGLHVFLVKIWSFWCKIVSFRCQSSFFYFILFIRRERSLIILGEAGPWAPAGFYLCRCLGVKTIWRPFGISCPSSSKPPVTSDRSETLSIKINMKSLKAVELTKKHLFQSFVPFFSH